ncbi:MAG: hypothetical protein ACFBQW_00880 [Sphingomonadaceae bacterium]
MSDLPDCIKRAERARLFPILAETSKEGRTLSIFLATLAKVRELRENLLKAIGQPPGKTGKLRCYTEIEFKCARREPDLGRPDGLLVLDKWGKRWTALVEAKVGKEEISAPQLERYLELAKKNRLDAVITISNQFSAVPQHHPLQANIKRYGPVELFHFSWMHILTEADLLVQNKEVGDDDQAYVLSEFRRFISHDSAGVQNFKQMPHEWSELLTKVKAGGTPQDSLLVHAVAEAWQQEARDLCLTLSRQLQQPVRQRLSWGAKNDPQIRFADDVASLCDEQRLEVEIDIPDAASPLLVTLDLRRRSILVSMKLKAPRDRKSSRARLNWLLRQIPQETEAEKHIHIRCQWPATSPDSQFTLSDLRDDPDRIQDDKGKMQVTGFEVIWLTDLGHRFEQRRTLINELEEAVPAFYEHVGQHLKAWQPRAPKMKEERSQPEQVSPQAISLTAEDGAIE